MVILAQLLLLFRLPKQFANFLPKTREISLHNILNQGVLHRRIPVYQAIAKGDDLLLLCDSSDDFGEKPLCLT